MLGAKRHLGSRPKCRATESRDTRPGLRTKGPGARGRSAARRAPGTRGRSSARRSPGPVAGVPDDEVLRHGAEVRDRG
eukprot:13991256-Alexandrium_andersonii.AAC.1